MTREEKIMPNGEGVGENGGGLYTGPKEDSFRKVRPPDTELSRALRDKREKEKKARWMALRRDALGALNGLENLGERGAKMHGEITEKFSGDNDDTDASLFAEIQNRLEKCIKKPNSEIEETLKKGRLALIRAAKGVGVFKAAKPAVLAIQELDYEKAEKRLGEVNRDEQELTATYYLEGSSPDFAEMVGDYYYGAQLIMFRGLLNARRLIAEKEGKKEYAKELQEVVDACERKRDLVVWGEARPGFTELALQHFESKKAAAEARQPSETQPQPADDRRRDEKGEWGDLSERYGGNIVEAIREGFEGRLTMTELVGMSEEEQRREVRKYLEIIEDSELDIMADRTISPYVVRLESSYKMMHENVRKEVRARLSVCDTDYWVKKADGFIENFGTRREVTISDAIAVTKTRGHLIGKETALTFLGNNLPDLKIKKAWNLLEDINSNGYVNSFREYGVKLGRREKPPQNWYTDSDVQRKEKVTQWVLRQLGGGHDIQAAIESDKPREEIEGMVKQNQVAEKSLQLADKFATATFQKSRWNIGSKVGNDQVAECIHFQEWRAGKAKTQRVQGAKLHYGLISQLGDTWLMNSIGSEDKVRPGEPLYARMVDFDELEGSKGLDAYSGVGLFRYWMLKKLFVDQSIKASDINGSYLQLCVVYFNEAEKARSKKVNREEKSLRELFVAQIVDLNLSDIDLDADVQTFTNLKYAVSRENLSVDEFGHKPFIDRSTWRRIARKLKLRRRMVHLEDERRKKDTRRRGR
jgi:hypothetical protein